MHLITYKDAISIISKIKPEIITSHNNHCTRNSIVKYLFHGVNHLFFDKFNNILYDIQFFNFDDLFYTKRLCVGDVVLTNAINKKIVITIDSLSQILRVVRTVTNLH
jgi:hypothetical protein